MYHARSVFYGSNLFYTSEALKHCCKDFCYFKFSFHWNKLDAKEGRFKLRGMILPDELNRNYPEESALVKNTNYLRSDHIRFWFANNKDYYASLKSVHISDTGTYLPRFQFIFIILKLHLGSI